MTQLFKAYFYPTLTSTLHETPCRFKCFIIIYYSWRSSLEFYVQILLILNSFDFKNRYSAPLNVYMIGIYLYIFSVCGVSDLNFQVRALSSNLVEQNLGPVFTELNNCYLWWFFKIWSPVFLYNNKWSWEHNNTETWCHYHHHISYQWQPTFSWPDELYANFLLHLIYK